MEHLILQHSALEKLDESLLEAAEDWPPGQAAILRLPDSPRTDSGIDSAAVAFRCIDGLNSPAGELGSEGVPRQVAETGFTGHFLVLLPCFQTSFPADSG